jgi:DNA primase
VKATLRGLEVTRQAMDHSDEMSFDPRGLVRHEARLEADVRVTTLPPGMDPDEVVLRDPAEWGKIVENAQPVVIHVMETLAAGRNLEDPKVKSELAAQVLPLIEDVPNAIERDAYRQRLARLLKVDESALVGAGGVQAPRGARKKPRISPPERRAAADISAAPAQVAMKLEGHSLRLLLRQPDALYLVDRALQGAGLGRLGVSDYESAEHQMVAKLILQSLDQDDMEPTYYIRQNLPEVLQDVTDALLAPLEKGEPNAEKLMEDLIRTVIRLRQIRITDTLNQLRFLQEEIQQQGDLSLGPYQESFAQYIQVRDRLDKASVRPLHLE